MKPEPATPRHTVRNYSETVYGARVPYEDARVLEDYARVHHQTRGALVRLALHQFVLRQQMLEGAKDRLKPLTEQALAEHLQPLATSLAELTASCRARAHQPAPVSQTSGPLASHTALATLLEQQRQVLEKLLVTAMLTLRLQVTYSVAPVLDGLPQQDGGAALTPHLAAADNGREQWSEATRAVYQRTGRRILAEIAAATEGTGTAQPSAHTPQ